MNRTFNISLLISLLCFNASIFAQKTLIDYFQPMEPIGPLVSNGIWGDKAVLPRDIKNGLEDSDMSDWCYWDGSIVKDDAGKYHMYACRWTQSVHHQIGWTEESKGMHATSDNLFGPYIDQGETWHHWNNGKGSNVIGLRMHDGRYALVSSEITPGDIFVSDNPNGPWEHLGEIQVDYNGYKANLAHYFTEGMHMANVMIFIRPDGRYMLLARNCAPMISETGIIGPYRMLGEQAWKDVEGVPQDYMEDPTIWYSDGLYHIVVNHHSEDHSYHLTSLDGIHNWKNRGLAMARGSGVFRYTDGTVNNWYTIQRQTVYIEDDQVQCFNLSVIDVHKGSDGANDENGSKIIVVPFDGENFGKDMRAMAAAEEAVVDATPLPSPWKTTDVGAVNIAGKAGYDEAGSVFKMSASGAYIGSTTDEFGFTYQKLSGDMAIMAQVMMMDDTDPMAKSGVMIRENLNADAKYAAMLLTPKDGAFCQSRTTTGGASQVESMAGPRTPYWVRLVKKGNRITSYISSSNLSNWKQVKEITLDLGTEYYIGVAVSSHNANVLNTTRFRKVEVYSPNHNATDKLLSHNMTDVVPMSGQMEIEVEYATNGERDIIVSLRDLTNWKGMGEAKATVSGMGKVTIPYKAVSAIQAGNMYQWEINMRPKGASWQQSLFETFQIVAYPVAEIVKATAINLSPQSLSLDAGQTKTVTAILSPANVTNTQLQWRSANPYIAMVDAVGKVTAISAGTTTITALANDGKVQASISVIVSGEQLPDKAINIPGVIEAEKFTNTGGLISDNAAGLGVFRETNAISYVNEGDWAEYDINVTEDGVYGISYSISSNKNGAQIQFLLDGKVISTDDVNNNGSWNTWYSLEASNSAKLYKGLHTVRIKGVGDNNDFQWNLDKISLSKASDIPTGLNNQAEVTVSISPNPFDNTLQIVGDEVIAFVKVTAINGVPAISTNLNASSLTLNTSELKPGIYLVQLFFGNGDQRIKKVIKL